MSPCRTKLYSRERFSCVLGEHCGHDLADYLKLRLIKSSHFDKNVCGVQRDLRVVAVNNRRQRANNVVRVMDDRIHRRVPDDVKVLAQMLIFLLV